MKWNLFMFKHRQTIKLEMDIHSQNITMMIKDM